MADRKDFEAAALPHLDAVYRAAYALCGNHAQAEDLAQATFLRAWKRFDSYRPGTNCRAWLLRILRNRWIDMLRHRGVTGPMAPLPEDLAAEEAGPVETSWSNAEDVLENFSDEQVIAALRELPDDQRLALFLLDVEGLTQEEAADVLDVAVGTVKSRTSRARRALHERLFGRARDLGWVERKP
ncbi:MAG: sigma-70 family RNA polymerase sigma factor [Phycisphaerae bacterium]